jgi:two-component system chemotaxis response regulator CheY
MDPLRTLIVDDSSVMRKVVARALEQGGVLLAEILEAGNGSEALEILRRHKVDLILSDINMPVMDGLEFVRNLKGVENAQGVPVVMITTESSESHVREAISSGATGYIRKPFSPDQMKEQVLRSCKSRQNNHLNKP